MSDSFDFLISKKLLCKDYTNLVKNDVNYNSYSEKSILNKYYDEIKKIINESNYNTNLTSNPELQELNTLFDNFLINLKIDDFCKKLFKLKSKSSTKFNVKSNIQEILNKFKNINNQANSNKQKNNIILNPLFNSSFIQSLNLNISNTNNFINNNQKKKLLINLDILTQGEYINILYPTLGIIQQRKSNLLVSNPIYPNYKSIIDLFNNILHNIYEKFDNYFNLPIQFLDFGHTICKLLNDSNNLEIISSIKEYVNTTDISMEDIMTIKEIKRNKIVLTLNPKYIIPYEYVNDEFKLISPKKIKKYIKNYKLYFEEESKIYDRLIKSINDYTTIPWKFINKSIQNKYYKLLYLFYYRSIILLHDIYYDFINKKVNKFVMSLKLSNNKIYKDLNYVQFLSYIEKMNHSLINLKKILLNNLYNIYKPTIIGKNYGIIYDRENYGLIPLIDNNNLFSGNEENIINKLFYQHFIGDGLTDNYKGNVSIDFFIKFKESDYYNKESKLFIGTSYDSNKHIESILGLLSTNSGIEKKHKKTTLKIINYTIKIFQKCIPIELLKNILNKKDYFERTNLNEKDKNNLKNYIIKEFNFYIKESTKNILLTKKSNNKKLLMLQSKIYYNISYFIMRVVQINIYNIDLKNQILSEIEKMKSKYLKIIKEKLK